MHKHDRLAFPGHFEKKPEKLSDMAHPMKELLMGNIYEKYWMYLGSDL